MRNICFLSMDDLGSYVADDDLAIPPLAELGFEVSTLSWRQTTRSWSDFECVIIRTPWDFHRVPNEFLDVLAEIESATRLENPVEIVRWNFDKRYLRDLSSRGCRIVPTIWDAQCLEAEFERWLTAFDTEELIIKPTVSATAENTHRLKRFDPAIVPIFRERPFMVQPFMRNIVSEGEYSLFYFNGVYSHAIKKMPKTADFRVQEEHGGVISSFKADQKLLDASQKALDLIGTKLLYARVDLVRDDDDEFCLMELELIEPALYLRTDSESPTRFARAIDQMLR